MPNAVPMRPRAITDQPARAMLMEGMRRLDIVERLRRRLPAPALVRLLGGDAEDDAETAVLAQLGPGSRRLGDIVAGVLVSGDRDEYDALQAVQRLAGRGVVRVEVPGEPAWTGGGPQPELER